jgi:hypothetical protein
MNGSESAVIGQGSPADADVIGPPDRLSTAPSVHARTTRYEWLPPNLRLVSRRGICTRKAVSTTSATRRMGPPDEPLRHESGTSGMELFQDYSSTSTTIASKPPDAMSAACLTAAWPSGLEAP